MKCIRVSEDITFIKKAGKLNYEKSLYAKEKAIIIKIDMQYVF